MRNPAPSRVLIATRSQGKMRELRAMFAAAGVEVVSLDDAGIPETGDEELLETAATFEDNALAKARYFHHLSRLPAAADDSGIEVDALGGAPGVQSRRWSGRPDLSGQALDDANNALLLARLAVVPGGEDTSRHRARYVCAAAYCDGDAEFVECGEVVGRIIGLPRGHGGFGYDPYFESEELGKTFGEASLAEKARVSHRARAFSRLLRRIVSRG